MAPSLLPHGLGITSAWSSSPAGRFMHGEQPTVREKNVREKNVLESIGENMKLHETCSPAALQVG